MLMRFFFLVLALYLCGCQNRRPVDLLVYNAHIYTVDSLFHTAAAMAVKDGKIVALGSREELEQKFTTQDSLDAGGQFLYPGLIDAHCHFLAYGSSLQECDLTGTGSWSEVLQRVNQFAATHPDGWLIGRGWDQNDWQNRSFPVNDSLNILFPERPVILGRVDGHAAIANGKALDLAGITPVQTIAGGSIRHSNGRLTGLLVDNAVALVRGKIPKPSAAQLTRYLQDAEKNCFAAGLTSVQDCGLDAGIIPLLQDLYRTGKLAMRMYVMLSDKPENYAYLFDKGRIRTAELTVNGFKLYADGALGSRGACLLSPYSDLPGHSGFLLKPKAYYDSILPLIAAKGLQACTHAIGDSANRTILNLYNQILPPGNNLRWRIEHAQVVHPSDFRLFGKARIVPSVQPTHATSDMYWAHERLGKDRITNAYAYQQLLQQNGWIPLGTDFPVEHISPMKTFYAATIRKDTAGYPSGGFQAANALTREQALRGMTIWAAKAAFEEQQKGSLEPGKFADFILLNQDLLHCDPRQILQAKVLATYSHGKKVY